MIKGFTKFAVIAGMLAVAMASCQEKDEIPAPVIQEEEDITLTAAFIETLSGAGSVLTPLWAGGAKFKTAAYNSAGEHPAESTEVLFTASSQGETSSEFSCGAYFETEGYTFLSFYPSSALKNFGSKRTSVTYAVPSKQTAKDKGYADGLNYAISLSEGLREKQIPFYNLLSPVKFTLEGEFASSVSKVVLSVNSGFIAGTVLSEFSADGIKAPQNVATAKSITLEGPFNEGESYYFMTVPGSSTGGALTFYNSADRVMATSTISHPIERVRSCILDLGTVSVDTEFEMPEGVTLAHRQTKGRKPNVLVLVGDGWTAGQQSRFMQLARSGIDMIFNEVEPLKTYKEYYTVYIMSVVSKQQGASVTDGKGNIITRVDNYFGSRWGEDSYDDMNCDRDVLNSYVSSHTPEIIYGDVAITDVPIAVLVNESRYGGRAYWQQDRSSYCLTPIVDERVVTWALPYYLPADNAPGSNAIMLSDETLQETGVNSGDWRQTLLHEWIGHAYAYFSDEYWYGTYTDYNTLDNPTEFDAVQSAGFRMNVTGHYDNVPWQSFLDMKFELAARDPGYLRIGKFQGGGGNYMFGVWRSEIISCMIDNRNYFSTWQRWLLYKTTMTKAGETPELEEFLRNDVTFDPVRAGIGTKAAGAPSFMAPPRPRGGCVAHP